MEAMMVAQQFIESGHPVTAVLKILDLSRSSFYYVPKEHPLPRGKSKSEYTKVADGSYVSNEQVVKDIKELLAHEFVDYGYLKTTYWLRKMKRYIINDKKVYRLMKENHLLNLPTEPIRDHKKQWIKEFVPKPTQSLEYFEMDIKYIYIQGLRRNVLLLSVIDVESRWLIGHTMSLNIKQNEVVKLFDHIFQQYDLPKRMYIRNDNGPQFVSEAVQEYFKNKEVIQEFTIPATPEQNAHIESYHSILERVICRRFQFTKTTEAKSTMDRFVTFYNMERIHSGIGYQSPNEYLHAKGIDMNESRIITFGMSRKTEIGNAEEQPMRDILTDGINKEVGDYQPPHTNINLLIQPLCLQKPNDK